MKLSIVVPTYNRAALLHRAVKSVLRQQFSNWELIIVDDGSTDRTQKVVQKFLRNNRRIKYYRFEQNRGFTQARNFGVTKATGDWVCFLDSDDEYLPGALAIIHQEIEKAGNRFGLLQFILKVGNTGETLGFHPDGHWDYWWPSYEEIVLKKGMKKDMHRCFRKTVARRYPYPEDNFGLETLYYADLAKAGVRFLYVNRPVVKVYLARTSHNHTWAVQWPKQFAQSYGQLVTRHAGVFVKHKRQLFDHQIRIMRCYLRARDPRFLWWAGRAFFNQPKKFIAGVKRII